MAGIALLLILFVGACAKEEGEILADLDTEMGELEGQETAYEDTGIELDGMPTEIEITEIETTETENTEAVAVMNPIQEVDYKGLIELTGIPLNVPEEAKDVAYLVINGTNPIAQVKFSLDGKEYCYRACATGEFEAVDISGLYYEWSENVDIEVGYCAGKMYTREGIGVVTWLDIALGINYTLSCDTDANGEELLTLADSIFVELQGDSE